MWNPETCRADASIRTERRRRLSLMGTTNRRAEHLTGLASRRMAVSDLLRRWGGFCRGSLGCCTPAEQTRGKARCGRAPGREEQRGSVQVVQEHSKRKRTKCRPNSRAQGHGDAVDRTPAWATCTPHQSFQSSPGCCSGKAANDGPSARAPGRSSGPLALVGIWGINLQMEDLALPFK